MQIVALEVLERMCTHLTCALMAHVNNSISHAGYQPAIGSRLGEVKVAQHVPWIHANRKGEDFASVLNMRRDHGTQGTCKQMAMEMEKVICRSS
jgi:hypothetical protein